jgi:hypothetical protein
MSFKAKGLHFEAKEPAFLRRLRNETTSGRDADRHERQIARPKRTKGADDDDDGPTYVLEEGNKSLTKAEYEALIAGKDADDEVGADGLLSEKKEDAHHAEEEAGKQHSKQQLTEVGAVSKKRKAVKIVQASDEEGGADPKPKEEVKKLRKKKKAKAIKLSFGDDD